MKNVGGSKEMKNRIRPKKYSSLLLIFLLTSIVIVPSVCGNSTIYWKGLGSTAYDVTDNSEVLENYCVSNLGWGFWWPDFPGRYEPFFEVKDIVDFGQAAWGLTSADFNNDDMLDFAVSWATDPWTKSTISIFYNDGSGGFTRKDVYTITEPYYLRYIEDLNSGDYDNDGDIDLLFTYSESVNVGKENGTVNLLLNDGANNFVDCMMVARLLPIGDEKLRVNPQVSSADFDDDGDIDFLVGDNSGLVEFYRNDGSGNFNRAGIYDFGGEMSWGLSSADFDNDGDIDFIVTQEKPIDSFHDGCIILVFNDGTEDCFNQSNYVQIAILPPETSFYTGPIRGFGCLCTMDYNDDGLMDFVFSGGDSILLFIQNNTGFFDDFTICRLPSPNGGDGWFYLDDLREGGIATGDFNGDNLDDLVVGGVQGVVRVFTNNFVLVDIISPDRASVFVNNEIKIWMSLSYRFLKNSISIVFGGITVVAKELKPLQKVEFFLDGKLMFTDESKPFEWIWDRFSFGRHKIKAVAYNMDGKQAGYDDAIVWKFF